MVDPTEIADNLVAMWSAIPDLAMQMGATGGASTPSISAYHDAFPASSNTSLAIRNMRKPSILVFYSGQEPDGDAQRISHRFTAIIRMKVVGTRDETLGYSKLVKLMMDGMPEGSVPLIADGQQSDYDGVQELAMRYSTIHPYCDPMNAPTWQRITDTDGLDYFQMDLQFTERGY